MNFLSVMPFMKRDFLEGREAVKRESQKKVRESLVMCIDSTLKVSEMLVIVARSVSKTEEQVSSVFKNRAETRGFYGTDFRSSTEISTESVVLTRACDA